MTGDVTPEFVNVSVERMFTAAKLVEEVRPVGTGGNVQGQPSPIREALFALENEGTVTTEPYRGAILKPLSAEEVSDIAELRLTLTTLAAKAAHRLFPRLILTLLMGSQSRRPAAKAPKNTSSTTATFGTSYSRKPNGPFFGRRSGSWTTE